MAAKRLKSAGRTKQCGIAFIAMLLAGAGWCRGEFAIRDGDVVVFLGDSITAARQYGKIIENYTLLRFPERKVRFVNAGWGGDTAEGGLKRLERDVFAKGATVLTVAYGINDIGWGMRADDEHKQKYLSSVRGIVEACKKRGVRVYICSAAITAEDPKTAENGYLQKMCDEGMAVSKSMGEGAIDVQRMMRQCQRKVWAANEAAKDQKNKETLHAADGIHLNDYGQIAMAYAILKGLGAPAEVSSAVVDGATGAVIEAKGCKISAVAAKDRQVEFDRLDEGLPWNMGLVGLLSYRWVPIPEELNRYMLGVRGLAAGKYEVVVDGRMVGTYSEKQLGEGVNIGSATPDGWEPGGPWDVQAMVLRSLTDGRNELENGGKVGPRYLTENQGLQGVLKKGDQINAEIEGMQRMVARPVKYRFVIRQAGATVAGLTQEGYALWQQGNLAAAAEKFEAAVKLDPKAANAWNGLGWVRFNGGQAGDAEKAFAKAVELEPGNAGALNGLGQVYLSQRKYAKAEEYLLKAAPNAPAAWWGLAKVYLLQGKFDKAKEWAEKIVAQQPGDKGAKQLLDAAKAGKVDEDLRRMIEPAG